MYISEYLQLIKKNSLYIIIIILIINAYPLYKLYKVESSSDKLLTIEIAPVNEIELKYLRDLESKISFSKTIIESSYFDQKDQLKFANEKNFTPQNLLALYFDTAVSRESIKNFLINKDLTSVISEKNFNFKYNTSRRIDPFTGEAQKTLVLSLKVPSNNYLNLLNDFTNFIDIVSKDKIKEQIEISINNISFDIENFINVVDFKNKENLNKQKLNLGFKIEEIKRIIKQINNDINNDLSGLNLIKENQIKLNKDEEGLLNLNVEQNNLLEKEFTFTFNSDSNSQSPEEILLLNKFLYKLSQFNKLYLEKISLTEKLNMLLQGSSAYSEQNIIDQNSITQYSLLADALSKEREKLTENITIVNKNYTDVIISNFKLSIWYFVASTLASIFFIILFLITVNEINRSDKLKE